MLENISKVEYEICLIIRHNRNKSIRKNIPVTHDPFRYNITRRLPILSLNTLPYIILIQLVISSRYCNRYV